MSPEEKELLEKTHTLTVENNKMLHAMRRSMKMASVMSFLYWIFIIGSAIGAYYFIKPYVDPLISIYSGAGEVLKNFKELGQ